MGRDGPAGLRHRRACGRERDRLAQRPRQRIRRPVVATRWGAREAEPAHAVEMAEGFDSVGTDDFKSMTADMEAQFDAIEAKNKSILL